jgi:MYND finger
VKFYENFSYFFVNMKKVCTRCEVQDKPLSKCSRCKVAVYCSYECQKEDWSNHKKHCKTLSTTNHDDVEYCVHEVLRLKELMNAVRGFARQFRDRPGHVCVRFGDRKLKNESENVTGEVYWSEEIYTDFQTIPNIIGLLFRYPTNKKDVLASSILDRDKCQESYKTKLEGIKNSFNFIVNQSTSTLQILCK